MEQQDLKVTINDKDYQLLITLGFWKRCGFKREEANIIEQDPDVYSKALQLAIFYGNKKECSWNSLEDMVKELPMETIEELSEDHSEKLSFAMIHYLPKKMREIILSKMKDVEAKVAEAMDNALNLSELDDDWYEKKN